MADGDVLVTGENSGTVTSMNLTTTPWTTPQPHGEGLRCDYVDTDYSVVPAILSCMCFMFGVLYTFFGYRFFKAVMFLTGFIFASILVYTICQEEDALPPEGNIGVAVGAGILCGLVTMLIQYVGLFLTGFDFGVALGMGGLIVVEQFTHPETKWIPIGVLVGVGLVFAVLGLKFQKAVTILGTSVLGGALMVTCLDYFIEQAAMLQYTWDRIKGDHSTAVCWYSWVILGCWPFCLLVGVLVQWRITGMGIDHREALHSRKGINLQRLRMRQKREAQQTRYRHLYQVRRVNGDVISQSVREKMSPAMQSLTTINPDPSTTTEVESATTTLTQVTGSGTT
ncbi:transmembrane protein 198-like isoform X2 [Babylonia areolata]|uniref:transmembrane protein 198-like isoform X2 n=1 Tax=Babylonia areolata TaxID=304850 RepID=UPI003FD0DCAF